MADGCQFQTEHIKAIAQLELEVEHQEEQIKDMDHKLDKVIKEVIENRAVMNNGLSARIADHMSVHNIRRGRRRDWILAVLGVALLGMQVWFEYGGA